MNHKTMTEEERREALQSLNVPQLVFILGFLNVILFWEWLRKIPLRWAMWQAAMTDKTTGGNDAHE